MDADSVAPVAIMRRNEKLEAQIAAQADELARVKAELAALRDLLRGVIAPR